MGQKQGDAHLGMSPFSLALGPALTIYVKAKKLAMRLTKYANQKRPQKPNA